MTSQAFHLFPDLPWELRRMIWEAAVHPMTPGIHTFALVSLYENRHKGGEASTRQKALPFHASGRYANYLAVVPETEDDATPNRSAYLWDAGLWTACWESRDAIKSCLNMAHWHQKGRKSIAELWDDANDMGEVLNKHANISTITVAPSVQAGGEEWQLVVRPYQDAIKPTIETMRDWLDKYRIPWEYVLDDLPFSADYRGRGFVRSVVVEYDASWLLDWPLGGFSRADMSPRHFVYNMVREVAWGGSNCFIWLIDRGEYEEDAYGQVEGRSPTVFHDCDDEYVEVVARWSLEDWKSAARFITVVDDFGDYGSRDGQGFLREEDRWHLHAWNRIGVLRPRGMVEYRAP